MTRFLAITLLAGIAGCNRGTSSRVILPPDGIALDSTGAVERRFVDEPLALVAQAGGTEGDTTLMDPYIIAGDGNRVYVVEGDQLIQAYDTQARKLWTSGKTGSGPGEYRNIRDLKLAEHGEIWVHDPANARITRLDSTGAIVGFIPTQFVGHSENMIPGPGTTAILLPPYADADILTIDSAGRVVDRDTIPWRGFHELEHLSRQFETANDPATGRWTMGFTFGNGWLAFDQHGGSPRRYYVEPTQFPPVIKEVSNGGATVASRLMRGELSGAGFALQGDTVFVLFGGKELFRQKIDLYSWTTGKYLGTIALPESVDNIAVAGTLLYTLSVTPYPKLAIYRRVGSR
ncbi:MAG TPA: hypothetical protein VG817_03920 [Gemmatimonadales bacterium]|nr:hypothetical protein [Gemmatimonadales bacterium]